MRLGSRPAGQARKHRRGHDLKLTLFHYWRSAASWRVRWGFELKKIECELVHVSLLDGESESETHLKRNPLGYVPVLQSEGRYLAESMAILNWAEECFPTPALLPGDAWGRAQIRMLSEIINASTQPLQNLNPTQFHSSDPIEQKRWMQHWIRNGLQAYETLARPLARRFSVGDQITLADLFLIPQCYSARRQEVDLTEFPTVRRIWEHCLETPECQASAPEKYEPKP